MKALIRNKGETLLESYNVPGINWKNGYPLTNPKWCGGPYTLVQNYVPPEDDEPAQCDEVVVVEEEIVEDDDYVIIDGKKYSKEKLRSLLE